VSALRPAGNDPGSDLRAIAEAEPAQDAVDVVCHRPLGDDESVGDLVVAQPTGDQRRNSPRWTTGISACSELGT
jgi:hypothetical protein